MRWAVECLAMAGFSTHGEFRTGEPEAAIADYVRDAHVDLLVMGAYGHSRIRQLIVGSTTTTMLRTCHLPPATCHLPVLLLR